jgi:transposase-like protein
VSEANQFKTRVALEALKGIKTISQIAQDDPVQVSTWKKELQERLPEVFGSKSDAKAKAAQSERGHFVLSGGSARSAPNSGLLT